MMRQMAVMLIVMGILFLFSNRLPIGRLPGDIMIAKGNIKLYFPVATCIVVSIILSLIFRLMGK